MHLDIGCTVSWPQYGPDICFAALKFWDVTFMMVKCRCLARSGWTLNSLAGLPTTRVMCQMAYKKKTVKLIRLNQMSYFQYLLLSVTRGRQTASSRSLCCLKGMHCRLWCMQNNSLLRVLPTSIQNDGKLDPRSQNKEFLIGIVCGRKNSGFFFCISPFLIGH